MTITAARGNVVTELASQPALDRLREVIGDLEPITSSSPAGRGPAARHRDRREPARVRARRLPRSADHRRRPRHRLVAVGSRCGSARRSASMSATARLADGGPSRRASRRRRRWASDGAAGTLVFSCNGRGSHMFDVPDHDATRVADVLGAPAGGFFCAGEIGPVGGRNFLHGFTATMAVFPLTRASMEGSATVRAALAEDLGSGDVTAEATVPPRRAPGADRPEAARSDLRARRRRRGVRGRPGPASSSRWSSRASGATRSRRRALRHRPGPGAARRRADRAQLPRPPLGDRDADGALRRGRGPRRGARSSTPARPPPASARSRRRRSAAAGLQPPDGPRTTRS